MRRREFLTLLGGAVYSDDSQFSSEPSLTVLWGCSITTFNSSPQTAPSVPHPANRRSA
jgi:hypothetical protein